MDTTDSSSVFNSNSNESFFSPGSSPGVLDDIVFLTILRSVSNCEDTMIELSSTGRAGDDTTGVMVEDILVGLDGNRDWLLFKSSLKSGGRISSNISVALDLELTLRAVILATS